MMTVDVLVTWMAYKAANLPLCSQYITVAKFEEDEGTWNKEAWSIVLDFDEPPALQGNPSRGKARFLIENAPVERLVTGRKFGMYEGVTKTAEIEIL
jgi:hypothetical protein